MPEDCTSTVAQPVFIRMGQRDLINLNHVMRITLTKSDTRKVDEVVFFLSDSMSRSYVVKDCTAILDLLENHIPYYQHVEE